ncbi:MAG: hypothetical protein KJ025_06175 [Burkholderiales bacterium]|nr:hypothetical protein [Burkholderiales bacterium]
MPSAVAVDVSYSQLAVFPSALDQPFNDWTDQHVAQGFSWRPGTVSFRTLAEAGPHSVEIEVVEHTGSASKDAVRAIEVPFEVPANGAVEVGSISDSTAVTLPPGRFLLRCEFLGLGVDDGQRVRLIFAKSDVPRFAVVRADEALSVSTPLLTTAQPAPG